MKHKSSISRELLNGLHNIMASGGKPQERLNKVVNHIAEKLNAEVCSCYAIRSGEILELIATKGLKQEAVHITRLRVGEGLVGEVAAFLHSVALKDAWSHPSFSYRPETGEEAYHSFLGVPIIRNSRISGVLVVQTCKERLFSQEEIETLETIAMILAELLSSKDFINQGAIHPEDGLWLRPNRMTGLRLSGGIGIGQAVLHHRQIHISKLIA
ncbi:MAG: GAF domain-containing protein, partial [Alphaproteobacteria bacterium]|nr:GAF domain-containing protein [Alphaproteobacteria bacterium]